MILVDIDFVLPPDFLVLVMD